MVDGVLYEVLKVSEIPLDYSSIAQLVEHAAVNRAVVGSSPTRGVFFDYRSVFVKLPGSMVKRLRHRPFTAVTRVRFPLGSLKRILKRGSFYLNNQIGIYNIRRCGSIH